MAFLIDLASFLLIFAIASSRTLVLYLFNAFLSARCRDDAVIADTMFFHKAWYSYACFSAIEAADPQILLPDLS